MLNEIGFSTCTIPSVMGFLEGIGHLFCDILLCRSHSAWRNSWQCEEVVLQTIFNIDFLRVAEVSTTEWEEVEAITDSV